MRSHLPLLLFGSSPDKIQLRQPRAPGRPAPGNWILSGLANRGEHIAKGGRCDLIFHQKNNVPRDVSDHYQQDFTMGQAEKVPK